MPKTVARRRSTGPRCVECRKPIQPGEQTHDVRGPAGHLMSQAHREVVNRWHLDCWAEVVRFHEASRAEAEQQRLATIRAMAEGMGMPPEEVSRIAAELGAPDPYAPVIP
jgi:hypothetical protein